MKIGLLDLDKTGFPNIALMKISGYYKEHGHEVEWYSPFSGHYNKVFISKVFSFTPDYSYFIDADEVHRGGTGYAISVNASGREVYDPAKDKPLPYEIEHAYPDYSLYPEATKSTAYGFLTRGCPRGCAFCIVGNKEGRCSRKVAELSEFYREQRNIVLCDPNILACREAPELLTQLADTGAAVDFNQGLDIRLMTKEKAELLNKIRIKEIHFAWDRYHDKSIILPKLQLFADICQQKLHGHNAIVYTIVNFDTTIEQDLERIYTLRALGYWAYVMVYNKQNAPKIYKQLQRWCNMRAVFAAVPNFEDYRNGAGRNRKEEENNALLF